MARQRLKYVDVARGIAMIAIVLGHLECDALNRVVYTFHLPLFYLISGWFLDARSGLGPFVRKKARQLLLPYYFTCLAYILATVAMNLIHRVPWHAELGDNLLATLFGSGASYEVPFHIPRIGALWFLWALFWAMVMMKLLTKAKGAVRLIAVAVIFGLSVWSEPRFGLPLSLQPGGCALLFVYVGWLLRRAQPRLEALRIPAWAKAAGVALALGLWLWFILTFKSFWLVTADVGRGALDILASCCGCLIVVLLSRLICRGPRQLSGALAFYGRHSLLFLSVHFIELRRLAYTKLYGKLLALSGLADTPALFVVWRVAAKLTLITAAMLILLRIPCIRRLYGYGDRSEARYG